MGHSAAEQLSAQGYFLVPVGVPEVIRPIVSARCWEDLDRAIREETLPGGVIYEELSKHARFSEIEFIISIRSSNEFPDEDGIWHDDGSRVLAFSLSLTLEPEAVEGGRLELRKRGALDQAPASLATPAFGTMIVFATGYRGFEHRILRVSRGERIIIAGWCT